MCVDGEGSYTPAEAVPFQDGHGWYAFASMIWYDMVWLRNREADGNSIL